jgi:cytochrome P450
VDQCVGASLARMQIAVILRCLLRRMPRISLAGTDADVVMLDHSLLRGLDRLLVRW